MLLLGSPVHALVGQATKHDVPICTILHARPCPFPYLDLAPNKPTSLRGSRQGAKILVFDSWVYEVYTYQVCIQDTNLCKGMRHQFCGPGRPQNAARLGRPYIALSSMDWPNGFSRKHRSTCKPVLGPLRMWDGRWSPVMMYVAAFPERSVHCIF